MPKRMGGEATMQMTRSNQRCFVAYKVLFSNKKGESEFRKDSCLLLGNWLGIGQPVGGR